MKVPHSEDLANHAIPESCVAYREVRCEAFTGVRTGQPLSRESFKVRGADAVSVAYDFFRFLKRPHFVASSCPMYGRFSTQ